MRRSARVGLLGCICAVSLLLLLAFLANLDVVRDPRRPRDADALAQWLTRHPADWMAANGLTEGALDLTVPRRVELWRAAYDHARRLSPRREHAATAFVRAGLFHWYELGAADRKKVLEAARPLMLDQRFFSRTYRSIFQLTRDFEYLRSVAPRTSQATSLLRDLAADSGRFDHYRELRREVKAMRMREFEHRRASATVPELLAMVPQKLDTGDVPLIRGILEELNRRTFVSQEFIGRIESLTTFAVQHRIQPLEALAPLVDTPGKLRDVTRAHLALALGDLPAAIRIESTGAMPGAPEWEVYNAERGRRMIGTSTASIAWRGFCGKLEICNTAKTTHRGPITVVLTVTQSDEQPPYVEVYLDDALVAEGEVRDQRSFALEAGPGLHRTEVRLVNRLTRGGIQRRVRLS